MYAVYSVAVDGHMTITREIFGLTMFGTLVIFIGIALVKWVCPVVKESLDFSFREEGVSDEIS